MHRLICSPNSKLGAAKNLWGKNRRFFNQPFTPNFDVIVIGGGHAGCEAATAASRTGARTALITQKIDTIGIMSCNPSIGGVGKGHLVKEIDALGGVMGIVADKAGIHFRILNESKGPAVQGLRCQADRKIYKAEMQKTLSEYPNLSIIAGSVENLILSPTNEIRGVILEDGSQITSYSAIITTGTFLSALIFLGKERIRAGRMGDPASNGLSRTLEQNGFKLGRLKTGTPPRLLGSTIDLASLVQQPGDAVPIPFSDLHSENDIKNQVHCWITRTTEETTAVVQRNLDQIPVFDSGVNGEGLGPRYCPSFETKVKRYPERTHNVFLEPEGLDTDIIYPNGLSMSLPRDVQEQVIRSITGCQNAEVVHHGYSVEYDFVDARQLKPTLETQQIPGLFMAGQINGTTGYEEAAAQGIIAGINAGTKGIHGGIKDYPPFVLDRGDGYIGVLINDLLTRGASEPYRMFTSRAEFRLSLRQDNSDFRLTPKGYEFGVVSEERYAKYEAKRESCASVQKELETISRRASEWQEALPKHPIKNDFVQNPKITAWDLLKRADLSFEDILPVMELKQEVSYPVQRFLKAERLYEDQIKTQASKINLFRREESMLFPEDLDFAQFDYLSTEEKEKLCRLKPKSLGQALRIDGITPSSLVLLHMACKKLTNANKAKQAEAIQRDLSV